MAIGPARPKVSNIPWELRLRAEYLAKFHAGEEVVVGVRLGPIPEGPPGTKLRASELYALGVFRRQADALILRDDLAILMEFALLPAPGDISLIELYGRLFRTTPDYRGSATLPIKLQIIGAIEDPIVAAMARERKIDYILYKPSWIDEYLSLLAARKRRRAGIAPASLT